MTATGSAVRAPGPMRRLIVNADDLGWSRGINRGVAEAHATGIVTSASLLAGMAGFDDAVELARAVPDLDIGVHLNVYRGRPVSSPGAIPSLLGADECFMGSASRIAWCFATGRIDLAQLASEFRAQIEMVRAAGIRPTHLDSDKHLHLWPSVFRVVCDLAKESGIPSVRVVREPPFGRPIAQGLSALGVVNARTASAAGLKIPDSTIGVSEDPLDLETLDRILGKASGTDVELVVHPGHLDDEFWLLQTALPNKLTVSREAELRVLVDPEARRLVERHGFVLQSRTPA